MFSSSMSRVALRGQASQVLVSRRKRFFLSCHRDSLSQHNGVLAVYYNFFRYRYHFFLIHSLLFHLWYDVTSLFSLQSPINACGKIHNNRIHYIIKCMIMVCIIYYYYKIDILLIIYSLEARMPSFVGLQQKR